MTLKQCIGGRDIDWKVGCSEEVRREIGSGNEGESRVRSQMTGKHRRQCWNEEHGNGSQGLTHEPFSPDIDITEQAVELPPIPSCTNSDF